MGLIVTILICDLKRMFKPCINSYRLAGTMAALIEKHEPSSIRKFLLCVQRGIRYVIRSTPGIFVQKCKYYHIPIISYFSK